MGTAYMGEEPRIRSVVERTAKPLRKKEAAKWRKLLRVHRAVVVGWCSMHRPDADPDDYELRMDVLARPAAFYIAPSGSDDPDAEIGPYPIEQGMEFARLGAAIIAGASLMAGKPATRRDLGDEW